MQLRRGALCVTLVLAAFAVFAPQARAESFTTLIPTPNRYFVFFSEVGGFGFSFDSTVFVANAAATMTTDGTLAGVVLIPEGPLTLPFSPEGRDFFGLGTFSDPEFSDHSIISADPGEIPNPLDPFFEQDLADATMSMAFVDPALATPGAVVQSDEGALGGHFGANEDEYDVWGDLIDGDGEGFVNWGTTSLFSGMGEDEIFIFPPAFFPIGTWTMATNSQTGALVMSFQSTQVPEPGLAALAIVGVAGVLVRRRRRRNAA